MSEDAIQHSGIPCPFLEHIQHCLLKIDGDDSALAANELRHRNGKHARAAAEIHYLHVRLDIRRKGFHWIVNPVNPVQ
jgi:hypothetical protein